jgi:hypothetical protein
MTDLVQPQDVRSPRQHWQLTKVIFQGDPESFSVAIGEWDGEPRLAMRWNANDWRPLGNPSSSGHPTWFIVPNRLASGIAGDTLRLLALSTAPDAKDNARELAAWLVAMGPLFARASE